MTDSPPPGVADLPGVVRGTITGIETVMSYGDPAAEYEALVRTAGIVERPDLTQLRVYGRDPVRMINGLVTSDVTGLGPERAVYGAMLTPKGRIISDMRVIAGVGEGVNDLLLDIPTAAAPAVADHLRKYLPPHFARWETLAGRTGAVGVYGPAAGALVARLMNIDAEGADEDRVFRGSAGEVEVIAISTRLTGDDGGFDLFADAAQLPLLWRQLVDEGEKIAARPAGLGALEVRRIEAGRGRFGFEITEETLPGELYESTGLIPRAISFTKGCYTGQEVVIRIAHRGHVNRHLRGLLLRDAVPGEERARLYDGSSGREAGWITSAAFSPRIGQNIALGYLRREVEPGVEVRLGSADGPGTQVVGLPFGS